MLLFRPVGPDKFAYAPDIGEDTDAVTGLHMKTVEWEAVEMTFDRVKYALNRHANEFYDLESYLRAVRS